MAAVGASDLAGGGGVASALLSSKMLFPVSGLMIWMPRRDLTTSPKLVTRDIYSGYFPLGGKFVSKLKNREEFEGGFEKRKGKGEKRKIKGKE